MATEQEFYDMTYIAHVISQGLMVGAPPNVIAERLVKTDLPGMGLERDEDLPVSRHGLKPKDVIAAYGPGWKTHDE